MTENEQNNPPKNNGENLVRDEQGKVVSGVLNPAGKPKGSRHFSTLFKEAVQKIAEGEAESEDVLIVKKAIKKAKEGDHKFAEMVVDRVDGKAPQAIDITTDGEKIELNPQTQAIIEKFEEELRKLKT